MSGTAPVAPALRRRESRAASWTRPATSLGATRRRSAAPSSRCGMAATGESSSTWWAATSRPASPSRSSIARALTTPALQRRLPRRSQSYAALPFADRRVWQVAAAGDRALLVTINSTIDPAVLGEGLALDRALQDRRPDGLINTLTAYASLLCHYDPAVTA